MTSSTSSENENSRFVSHTVNEKGHWIGEDGRRIPNLTDPVIMQHLLARVPYKLGPPSHQQKAAIKRILNWPMEKPFLQCKGKRKGFVRECEAAGNYDHSSPKHLCEECRCKSIAGQGTKGDFYGLGPETGHYGVSWCENCSKYLATNIRVREARLHMKALQAAGHVEDDNIQYEVVQEQEADMALSRIKVRNEMELVEEALTSFKKKLEDDDLKEYAGGKLQKMSDKTHHELILKYAKVISDINFSQFKMDKAAYIHFDEITVRLPRQIALGKQLFIKLRELIVNWQEGDMDPVEQINEEWIEGHREIWKNVKQGAEHV